MQERFRSGAGRPILLDRARAGAIAAEAPEVVDDLLVAADNAVDLRVQYFGYPAVQIRRPVNWMRDEVSGTIWPPLPSGKIDHRTAAGDAKWIWELNRLQHLPSLAEAWLFTGDDKYSEAVVAQLDSWMEQNPPGVGIAWRGAFEAGLRAISIAIALQGIRDSAALTQDRFRAIVGLLAECGRRCWAQRSLFSSANNHLVGEMAGLAVVAILFPELPSAARWEKRAVAALCREAGHQILPDGVGAEQSVRYQISTTELLVLVAALLRERDGVAPGELTDAIERGSRYLTALVGRSDPDPNYGDDDDGFSLKLGATAKRGIREHLAITAAYLGVDNCVAVVNLDARWYATLRERSGSTATAEPGGSFYAADGGVVVLRSGSRRITMDVGPLGYLSIAAHGHADALSITLSSQGQQLIGDSGSGSYYGHPEWRDPHRSTRAHGTVCIDRVDQSVIGGPFLWVTHARTSVVAVDLDAGVVDAEHDGYTRLDEPVTHRRWLIAPPDQQVVLVVDLVTGSGSHEITTSWPIDPALNVTPDGDEHIVDRDGIPVLQIAQAGLSPQLPERDRGDTETQLGWSSRTLESREPAWLVGATFVGGVPYVIATVLNSLENNANRVTGLVVTHGKGGVDVTWSIDGQHWLATIDPSAAGAVNVGSMKMPDKESADVTVDE
ncbi:hypothetical protein FGL95_16640 [Nocardiaceae bacterium YC2-7]|uniref:Heparin-sulfate lyase N-terminal domain-containing protein n=2 Tax=Antrihabitans stalactiti TaxID=2584121 RepID=A0A848KLK8_9NOCA|nr:hypothetical protein [Antrihabitans stalactiti]